MLYAQMLLAHAAGLLKGMLREVERDLSAILHKRKKKTACGTAMTRVTLTSASKTRLCDSQLLW